MAKEDEKPAGPKEGAGDMTAEQLKVSFPELIEQIVFEAKTAAAEEIAGLTTARFKKTFPKLYARVAADATGVADIANLKVPGFLLDIEDPFAAGAARVFAKEKKMDAPRLPIVLPFKDKASKVAIDSYIQRAGGGGDVERIKAASEALAKCK